MKCHKYKVGNIVVINENSSSDITYARYKPAPILELEHGALFDYTVLVDGDKIRVKESEIERYRSNTDDKNKIKIALAGKMRSGKDAIGEYAVNKYGFVRYAFGDQVREVCSYLFPEQMKDKKPRQILQRTGQFCRSIDEDIWVNRCFNEMSCDNFDRIIITDLRQPNEYQRCKKEGFTIIKIEADDNIRLERMNRLGDIFTIEDLNHETEQYIDTFEYDYVINNNGGLYEAYKQFDEIMDKVMNKEFGKR